MKAGVRGGRNERRMLLDEGGRAEKDHVPCEYSESTLARPPSRASTRPSGRVRGLAPAPTSSSPDFSALHCFSFHRPPRSRLARLARRLMASLTVLIIGSGGREHALAWKLSQSPLVGKIFVCPGNGGTSLEAKTVNVDLSPSDFPALVEFAVKNEVGQCGMP